MVDGIRFHDDSPYAKGFIAGYYFRGPHQPPTCPYRKGSRASDRWSRGFRAGSRANSRREEILVGRALRAAESDAREVRTERETRHARAAARFGQRPNP